MLAHEPGKVRREAGWISWAGKPPVARAHLPWCRSNTEAKWHPGRISGRPYQRRGLQDAPASPPCASVCAAAGVGQVAGSACCPGGCEGAGGLLLLQVSFQAVSAACSGCAGFPRRPRMHREADCAPRASFIQTCLLCKPALLFLPLHSLQAEEAQLHRMTKSLLDPSKIMLKDKMAFVIGGCFCFCTSVLSTSAFARAAW